jgi:hypothetical protein
VCCCDLGRGYPLVLLAHTQSHTITHVQSHLPTTLDHQTRPTSFDEVLPGHTSTRGILFVPFFPRLQQRWLKNTSSFSGLSPLTKLLGSDQPFNRFTSVHIPCPPPPPDSLYSLARSPDIRYFIDPIAHLSAVSHSSDVVLTALLHTPSPLWAPKHSSPPQCSSTVETAHSSSTLWLVVTEQLCRLTPN